MTTPDAIENLRQFIVQTRHAKRLTQREVARRGGIPHGTLGSLESGRQNVPSQETIAGIAKGLGVPYSVLDRIARGLPPEADVSIADQVLLWAEDDPTIRALLMEAARLPADKQAAFAAGRSADIGVRDKPPSK